MRSKIFLPGVFILASFLSVLSWQAARGNGIGGQLVTFIRAKVIADGASPTPLTAGSYGDLNTDKEGRLFVRPDHPRPVNLLINTSNTTATEIGAVVASYAYYITDYELCGATADTSTALQYGTGTNCGTGTTSFVLCSHVANGCCEMNFVTPIKVPVGKAVCLLATQASGKAGVVNGYLAP